MHTFLMKISCIFVFKYNQDQLFVKVFIHAAALNCLGIVKCQNCPHVVTGNSYSNRDIWDISLNNPNGGIFKPPKCTGNIIFWQRHMVCT